MFKLVKNKKGFTLIEIVISIAILGIIIIPISSLFITSAKINKKSNDLLHANHEAQQVIEVLRAGDVKSIDLDEVNNDNKSPLELDGIVYPIKQKNDHSEYDAVFELQGDTAIISSNTINIEDQPIKIQISSDDSSNNMTGDITIENKDILIRYDKNKGSSEEPINEPIKILVESHGDGNADFKVTNKLEKISTSTINLEEEQNLGDQVHFHIVRFIENNIPSKRKITVNGLEGKVFVVSNILYDHDKYDPKNPIVIENQLEQITVKVSKEGEKYEEGNELIEVTTLKKKE
ncbi:MAG: prepilin-type N-terminal cleavage/methylation domain-containing protein [Marinisporobacter sp.]|nr:prepilin-type N-terminal cleavage/methylation domain-containing protein [Marinisporobacter sp.]